MTKQRYENYINWVLTFSVRQGLGEEVRLVSFLKMDFLSKTFKVKSLEVTEAVILAQMIKISLMYRP